MNGLNITEGVCLKLSVGKQGVRRLLLKNYKIVSPTLPCRHSEERSEPTTLPNETSTMEVTTDVPDVIDAIIRDDVKNDDGRN